MGKNNTQELLAGLKFNRLKVIKFHHKDKKFRRFYTCQCDCGNKKIIHGAALVSGNTKSCGCLAKEVSRKKSEIAQNTKKGAKTAIYLQYKRHAKDRGYLFNVSLEELIRISQGKCHYCGTEPNNIKKTKNDKIGFRYNGIDRINNKKGYISKNCVPCCRICNYAKSNMSLVDFQEWAKRLGKNAMAEQWG